MRAVVIVLDGCGVGDAPDAAAYGDEGADTLGHLLGRDPALAGRLPTLFSLGLGRVTGHAADAPLRPEAAYGRLTETSRGKDSTTGHWELAGVTLAEPFAVFDAFPPTLVHAIERDAGVTFIGNVPASGTEILDRLGPDHLHTGRPILYTSADSVLQIAAHETAFGLGRLYDVCRVARHHADAARIGRVIARPFLGEPGAFVRTGDRHDFSLVPPPTVLNALQAAGVPTVGVGKIGDLFAGSGLGASYPTASNAVGMASTADVWPDLGHGLLFVNLVDFDTLYGHRRDPDGFAAALVAFDRWLGGFLPSVGPDDLLIVTADHGTDPTFRGTDHTRERVPLLASGPGLAGDLGTRDTFADVAATLAAAFGLPAWPVGRALVA